MFNNLFKYYKNDIPSGIVVFLVALPLCLGIAQASNAPIFSGIISGIVGGVVVSFFSDSKFGVSGPAAGLTIIVFSAISNLGFETFLLSVMIAGIIQFLLGQFKLGILGYFIPSSVIKGMLSSIGLIIILKQIPHAFGYDADSEGDFDFFQSDGHNTFSELLYIMDDFSKGAIIIFVISIIILFVWSSKKLQQFKLFQLLPASLVVVIVSILLNEFFKTIDETLALSSGHLVTMPSALFTHDYKQLFIRPDFSAMTNISVYKGAFTIAIVASIETLLSVEATDNLDPEKNITSTNKELKAQGIGNFISGLIGGIPITQVIVRSSANINANAKSKFSSIFHGILLIASVLLLPNVLERIPLSALAAILILVGIKLLNIKDFAKVLKGDKDSLIPYLTTVIAILFTDLLQGITIGLGVAMFFILRKNYEIAFIHSFDNNRTIISFAQIVSFLNKGGIMQTLQKIPPNSEVIISAKKCHTMSKDIVNLIVIFKEITSKNKNIDLELIDFEKFGIKQEETA